MIDLSQGPNLLLYGEQSAERDLFFASVKNDLRKHAPSVQLGFHYGDNLKSLVQESQNRYAYLHKKHCRTLGDYEQNYPNNEQGGAAPIATRVFHVCPAEGLRFAAFAVPGGGVRRQFETLFTRGRAREIPAPYFSNKCEVRGWIVSGLRV
jgi:hypothetical protein